MPDLTDAQLLELFKDHRADLSLLTPDEQSRLVKLTERPAAAPTIAPERPYLEQVKDRFLGAVKHVAGDPAAGASLAGIVAAPFTGGMSIPAAMGLMAGAGAAGAAPAAIAKGDLSAIPIEGALTGVGEGAGRAIAGTLRMAGRGLYRAAALPINKFGKYGDLISEGIENRVPVDKGGERKAAGMVAERGAEKAAAIAEADTKGGVRTRGVVDDARDKLSAEASAARRAGLPDPGAAFDRRLTSYEAANGPGLTYTQLEANKGKLDDTLGGAYRKLRMREPLNPTERYGVEMSQASSRGMEEAIPNYRDLNKSKMNAEGLRQLIARRVSPNGSGGNQGLENALTMLGGVSAIPARLAMLPPVLSRAGIGTHMAGKGLDAATPYLAALLAQLGAKQPDE